MSALSSLPQLEVHTFDTDSLPDEHPWAHKTVMCGRCASMVHAFNNECMQEWAAYGTRALCAACFMKWLNDDSSLDRFVEFASKFPCTNGD